MDFLPRVLYTAVSALSIFYFFVKVSLSHWKKRGILHEKPKFLWGNLKGVGSKRHITAVLNELYERYKGKAPFIGFYAWLQPLVLILDVELARSILLNDAKYFKARGLYSNIEEDPLSENLIQLDGVEYEQLRSRVINSYEHLNDLVPTLVQVASNFRRNVATQQRDSENLNIQRLIGAYTLDCASMIGFGLECDTLNTPNTEFRAMTRTFLHKISLLKMYLAWSFPTLARIFCLQLYNETASQYFLDLVRQKLEQRVTNKADYLKNFVKVEAEGYAITTMAPHRVAAQCASFLLAGLEATNSTLCFCLHELALQQEIQQKARDEIELVLTKHKDKITLESLREMVYLKQVLYETLRKHTPYPFLLRHTLEDYDIAGSVFMLQTGNNILIPVSSIHHDPSIYPNPQIFDPSRFEAHAMAARSPATFLPFGAGARGCIAREFAEFQMLICLATLLQQYKFSSCMKTNCVMQYDQKRLIVSPKEEIMLRLERIQN